MSRLREFCAACGSLLILAVPNAVRADDYAQWRGPARTGISKETGLLKEWPKEGPKLLWQVKDAGFGFGAPAVAGGKLYLVSNKGKDEEFVQARDAKDGKILWSTPIGKVGFPNQVPSYAGARSTPTVDGNLLYAMGSDGDLACLEIATGKLRWKKNVRTEFGGKYGFWAYAESPLVDGSVLVCTPGGSDATLLAVNKLTGDVIWKSAIPGGDAAGYSSPIVFENGGGKQYVQFVQKGLVGVDAKTGRFLWRYDKTAEKSMASIQTPVAYRDLVYSATGQNGAGLAKIKSTDGRFEAEEIYFSRKLPNAIGGVVLLGETLYGTSAVGLKCVDFSTGAIKWEDRSVGAGSLVAADGLLYLYGENGDVALVEATPEAYREKGRFTPPDRPEKKLEKSWAYPALSDGRLYIRDLGTLWCYDVKEKAGAR
jgi:outer membrane protein assembly factor BamB